MNRKNKKKRVNTHHKDRLFRFLFKEKADLLDLYNALNRTSYANPDELTVNTLEDAIYLHMKNDLSFIIGTSINLYEHQSTLNPNMPLRGFFYLAKLYQSYVEEYHLNVYGKKRIRLPFPNYLIFYNGTERVGDRTELFLSEAFTPTDSDQLPALECRATLLNINYGHNRELMESCKRLHDYAVFIDLLRRNASTGMTLDEAADRTIQECIRQGVLADVLTRFRSEVTYMILTEFDEKAYEKTIHQEGWDEGWNEGWNKGWDKGNHYGMSQKVITQVRKNLKKGLSCEELADILDESEEHIASLIRLIQENPTSTDEELLRKIFK